MHILLLSLLACGEKTNTKSAEPVVEQQAPPMVEEVTEEKIEVSALEQFGAEFTIETAVPAGDVFADPSKYVDQKVRITGKVSDVCQKMGCWMVITDNDQHMRVTTKAHAFFVAKDGSGSICDIEGTVVKKEFSEQRTEHFKSEQSEGAPIPKAEVEGTAGYEIVAEAITFLPASTEGSSE
tara:strand:+ start:141 stop:683 length:543 start_codon:yes stop_codon:yes gene_type:complete